ncbi:MAG: Non-homologous end joining protein Ku [Syntrophus sp. SKADARSKE-3]|nr:Non-homologous end joining protein Ku [Syntrophus sp. SKADARSKE-3]
MTGRAIWKGNIHFGDVDVPVKLHTAVRENRIQFHLLHRHDQVRLRQQMICAYEKVPVPAEEQIRGFEWEKGKYIILDPEELERSDAGDNRDIEIHEFVKADQIEPIFLERCYILEPDLHVKKYNTLVAAMSEMDVAGICSWTMRKHTYVGALEIGGKKLRLNSLRYADEVIPAMSLDLEAIPLSEKELKIGSDLITQLTAPFQPERFENEHQKKLQELIDQKARGEKIAIMRPRRLKPTTPDKLLQVLEASLRKVA